LTGPAYHSGLQGIGALEAAGPCDRAWSPRGSVVFRHDLQDFAPAEFDSCDVVYAELPWKGRNLNAFDERAGVKTNWSLMMASAVQWLGRAKVLGVPTIYPVGRWHMRYLFDRDGKLVASIRAKTAFEAKLLFKSGLVEGDLERGHVIRRL
jgi:hypothetical protein